MGLGQKKYEETGETFKMRSFKICHGILLEGMGQTTDHLGQES
jgi:hypothetical protein